VAVSARDGVDAGCDASRPHPAEPGDPCPSSSRNVDRRATYSAPSVPGHRLPWPCLQEP